MAAFIEFVRAEPGAHCMQQVQYFINCANILEAKFYEDEGVLEILYEKDLRFDMVKLEREEARRAMKKLRAAR